jgi:hypothetical protein
MRSRCSGLHRSEAHDGEREDGRTNCDWWSTGSGANLTRADRLMLPLQTTVRAVQGLTQEDHLAFFCTGHQERSSARHRHSDVVSQYL